MPKRRSPPFLKAISIQAIGNVLQNRCCNFGKEKCESEHDASVYIQEIFSTIPFQLVDEVFKELLKRLNEAADKLVGPLRKVNTNRITNLISLICDHRVGVISLENLTTEFQDTIIKCFKRMTGVRYMGLDLVVMSCDNVAAIMLSVPAMKNLTEFCHQKCTNEIISTIAQNCNQLQVLDVHLSNKVSDVCMMDLRKCNKLRHLNVDSTSVSELGCATALKYCPALKTVVYSKFSEVLKQLEEFSAMNVEFIETHFSLSELSLVNKLFPSLQEIGVDMTKGEFGNYVMPTFTKLRSLTIKNGWFYKSGINKVIDTITTLNLSSLCLCNVECLQVNALVKIAESCPYLSVLLFRHCNNEDQSPITSHYWSKATFRNLIDLEFTKSSINVEFILSSCPKIQTLKIEDVPLLSGDFILEMIKKYRMKYLKSFTISTTLQFLLDIDFVYVILQSLGNLEFFKINSLLNRVDLLEIQTYIKRNNLKVDFLPISTYFQDEDNENEPPVHEDNVSVPSVHEDNVNVPSEDEACEDEISEDEACEDEISEDEAYESEVPEEEACEDEISEDWACQSEVPEDEACEDDISEDMACQGEVPEVKACEDEISEDKAYQSEVPEDEACADEMSVDNAYQGEVPKGEACEDEISEDMACQDEVPQD